MAFRDIHSPLETDLLCESCGYLLNGLEANPQGRCPECGEPLLTSLDPNARKPAPIELAWSSRAFWQTTWHVLTRKRRFFRETLTRQHHDHVRKFGNVHRILAGILFGVAATVHLAYMAETRGWTTRWTIESLLLLMVAGIVLIALSMVMLVGVTQLAIAMTAAESRFWGMRLPKAVLARAMNFHAANYLPVSLVALIATAGYRVLVEVGILTPVAGVAYLVTLCVLVVVGAIWLFESFVIAMRRIRLANF